MKLLTPLIPLLVVLLTSAPVIAQTGPTDCDRLAGYDHTPRQAGLPGVYAVLDAPAAIAACEAALAAPGADPFLNFLLARALLAANRDDPRAVDLIEAGRPASTVFADSRLAILLEDGAAGLAPDPAAAMALSVSACAAYPDRLARVACNNLANMQIESDDPPAQAAGLARTEALCAADLAISCRNMGSHYYEDRVATADLVRALGYFDRGCALGNGEGCGWAGYLRENGEGTGIELPAAYTLYQRGCTLGDPWSCYAQGENLSQGLGVDRDWNAGLALMARACAMGEDEGCYHHALGQLSGQNNDGIGVTPEGQAAAIAYFSAACDSGSARACTDIGFAHHRGRGVAQDTALALAYHDRACEGGDAVGCNNMGVHHGLGLGVPVNMDTAIAYYRRACDADLGLGCFNLAEATAQSNPAGSAAARTRACELGHEDACD